MSTPATAEDVLSLLLDEVWDLQEAIAELERRRDDLRDGILAACRTRSIDRLAHARGTLRVERYASYKVAHPSAILPTLRALGWEDRTLQVKGRVLHALAAKRPDLAAHFSSAFPEVRHEVLSLTPLKATRARKPPPSRPRS